MNSSALDSKLSRAAQAIVKNHCVVICSGSGMMADCIVQGGYNGLIYEPLHT